MKDEGLFQIDRVGLGTLCWAGGTIYPTGAAIPTRNKGKAGTQWDDVQSIGSARN